MYDGMVLASSGNCIEVPEFLESIRNCAGEKIGEEELDMYYDQLAPGDCYFPNFEIVEESYPGNRYVYIDELQNDWYFRWALKWFIIR